MSQISSTRRNWSETSALLAQSCHKNASKRIMSVCVSLRENAKKLFTQTHRTRAKIELQIATSERPSCMARRALKASWHCPHMAEALGLAAINAYTLQSNLQGNRNLVRRMGVIFNYQQRSKTPNTRAANTASTSTSTSNARVFVAERAVGDVAEAGQHAALILHHKVKVVERTLVAVGEIPQPARRRGGIALVSKKEKGE